MRRSPHSSSAAATSTPRPSTPSSRAAGRRRASGPITCISSSDRAELDRHLRFRDRLRASSALRAEYAARKRGLAASHRADREAYSAGKTALVERVLDDEQALAVRTEQLGDRDAIRRVYELAFSPRGQEAGLVEALRAGGALVADLSLVALHGDDVVGHVCLSRARLDSGIPILVLGPMGVVPERQRRGLGSTLVRGALGRAARTDFPLVSVLGHSSYYPRFGFEPAQGYGIVAPFEAPSSSWMVYRLPAYRPDARGRVVYADAFGLPDRPAGPSR